MPVLPVKSLSIMRASAHQQMAHLRNLPENNYPLFNDPRTILAELNKVWPIANLHRFANAGGVVVLE
jgi:hypothetical protein